MVQEFLWKYIIGPIVADAQNVATVERFNVVAERGYNLVNELVWGLLLIGVVYGLVKLLQKWGIGDTPRFVYAASPWIVAGAILRVFEDASVIGYPWNIPFITPLIYLLVLIFLVAAIWIGHDLQQRGLVSSYMSVVGWSGGGLAVAAFAVLWFTHALNGAVFGLITMLAIFLFSVSDQILRHINHFRDTASDVVARWRRNDSRIAIFGHVLDGVGTAFAYKQGATLFGFQALGYGEKHPVSEYLLETFGSGYWFILVKYVLILGVLYFFDDEFRSQDPVFFNVLLLAVISIGLGPGVRDIVRVSFGV